MTLNGRHHFLLMGALVVVLLTLPQPSMARHRAPARIEFPSEVNIAGGSLETPKPGSGVTLAVSITSGEFFKGLVRTVGPSGAQFLKDGKPVSYFPEKIEVRIRAVASDGDSARAPWQLRPKLDADFMRSLRFSVASKRGLQQIPAQVIPSRAYEAPFRELGPDEWDYESGVRLKQVPLTDVLTVVVLSSDGKMLARLTGGLGWPQISLQPGRKAPNK